MGRSPKNHRFTREERARIARSALGLYWSMAERGFEPWRITKAMLSRMLREASNIAGSARAAAELFDFPETSFRRDLARGKADMLYHEPMHKPLDDTQFPFIRVGWTGPELGFVSDFCAWLHDVVQPRAQSESTKIVVLQNYSDFDGMPTFSFAKALTQGIKDIWDPTSIAGVVVYWPSIPNLISVWNGLMALMSYPLQLASSDFYGISKFSADASDALAKANQTFADAGITSHPVLTLD